ncbi:response regulator [Idiomarina sp. PL1-037]|jgi:response regulator receiver protein|uniref:response regulator transcription factor n=1 Tax=Idiomarina TaxID=135575 RepID=UPI002ACC0C71|nr:response regulator [Idiomarina sp. PL1-037]WQC53155.1 response regulator [Idiomarina sp. PL1-037]
MNKFRLLIIDDDEGFCRILQRRLEHHSVLVQMAHSAEQALTLKDHFDGILLDMMLGDDNGLGLIQPLNERYSPSHLVVLTGYASIATTVEAMKRGATDYLTKPVGTNELLRRFTNEKLELEDTSINRLTPTQIEWEHIQRVLADNQGNVSKTARELGMHRRTLQRKLSKRSPH